MSDVKQVKVDNWGIYFLQRLKHFFNRTDYCDLTLQFQDNAQLKVHRLVLSACTEYFELLERTCEMYEDCLVMPDDLQADVVVPIVNFMYTGQLEFRMDSLERLYQTSQIMNMPVLTKLLDAHRNQIVIPKPPHNFNTPKRFYSKSAEASKPKPPSAVASSSNSTKRSYTKAFGDSHVAVQKKQYTAAYHKSDMAMNNNTYRPPSPSPVAPINSSKKVRLGEPRPTRYELPEELDTDNIFDNSFSNISYASQPLMVHPDSSKSYPAKRTGIFSEASSSKKYIGGTSTADLVECKKITRKENIFEDDVPDIMDNPQLFQTSQLNIKEEVPKVSNHHFDQILDSGPKVTIETKDNKQASNMDHAKIISEVLKKYPHLVKSNKNIKLKILNTPSSSSQVKSKKQRTLQTQCHEEKEVKLKTEVPDFTYETDVLDSKEAAKLIAMGADNVKGPWICLICGTPGRALHFTSYYKFRRHLVEVHNEKPVATICEYCGLKSFKRNYLLHHLYTKHGVEPPPSYRFPKCNFCSYVALTEALLVKHKLTHSEIRNFRCNVCATAYHTSSQLLAHIQSTGHKYSADRKTNLQCIYCLKVFMREGNLYAHLKTNHKHAAKADGIIDDSDEERQDEPESKSEVIKPAIVKYEKTSYDSEYDDADTQYQIQQRPDGNIQLISSKKTRVLTSSPTKQKILNTGLNSPVAKQKPKPVVKVSKMRNDFLQDVSISPNNNHSEEVVIIDGNEYVMRDNQLILRKENNGNEDEYIVSDMLPAEIEDHTLTPTTSMEYSNIQDTVSDENTHEQKALFKKSNKRNQSIQFVVSNEEEYKALMNSNHSIIFDDGDTNKTLTVLSAPHNPTLNTNIDLDSTQSNDMMIIQDNFPLSVTEALPADNSNIVVVYSHPVDDQGKQFQLIASQDIGAQFVQSSAVITSNFQTPAMITQNFETITTTTPVMSAHVIDAQVSENWQSNIDNQHVEIATPTEIQEMSIVEQTELPETEAINSGDELPEVTLTTIPQPCNQENQIEESLNQADHMDVENEEQVTVEEIQNVSSTPVNDIMLEMVTKDNMDSEKSNDINLEETIPQNDTNIETSNVHAEEHQLENLDESDIVEHEPEEVEIHSEIINEETLNPQITENNANIEDTQNVQSSTAQIISVNNEEITLTKVTKEQIETLASEWSEDEYEIAPVPNEADEDTSRCDRENGTLAPEPPSEIEESIENIQQEMDKQMSESPEEEADTEGSLNSSQEDTLTSLQEQVQTNVPVEAPQEKISSLLNDWQDNDSQEADDSTNANDEDDTPTSENISSKITVETDVEKLVTKKDDNIKKLVSDWDDDEEENKN